MSWIKQSDAEKYLQMMKMVKKYQMGDNIGGYFGSDGLPFDQACFQSENSYNYEVSIEKYLDKTKHPNIKRNNKPDTYLVTVARDHGLCCYYK